MDFTFSQVWRNGFLTLLGEKYSFNTAYLIFVYVLCGAAAYFIGSLNFGLIISRYKFRDDVRSHGSGNAGMTNMLRSYGKGAAAVTLVGDMLKAVVAVLLVGRMLGGFYGAYIAGLCCVVGHVYPVYFGFKGGKGVAATAAMILCLDPAVFLILLIIFVLIVAFTKYLSLGSIVCMLIYPMVLYNISGTKDIHIIIAVILSVFVIFLHRENIMRLRAGTENKFSLKKKPAAKKSEPPDGKE